MRLPLKYEKRLLNMNFDNITEKLELAFDVTQIPKQDTCVLWASLSSDLLWNEVERKVAYPLYGTLTFKNKQTQAIGHYDSTNDSFHMATLYYSNGGWSLLDFSTKYLTSNKFNLVSLSACPVQIEIPELSNIEPNNTEKIEDNLKLISEISIETDDYKYTFIPESIHYLPNSQNSQELTELERSLHI